MLESVKKEDEILWKKKEKRKERKANSISVTKFHDSVHFSLITENHPLYITAVKRCIKSSPNGKKANKNSKYGIALASFLLVSATKLPHPTRSPLMWNCSAVTCHPHTYRNVLEGMKEMFYLTMHSTHRRKYMKGLPLVIQWEYFL